MTDRAARLFTYIEGGIMTYQPPDDAAFITAMETALESVHDYLKNEINPATGELKKKGAASAKLSALDIALQNETYRAAYQAFGDMLGRYERATETALMMAEAALEDVMNRAVTLPGIGPVFWDTVGDAVGIDGKLIDAT